MNLQVKQNFSPGVDPVPFKATLHPDHLCNS